MQSAGSRQIHRATRRLQGLGAESALLCRPAQRVIAPLPRDPRKREVAVLEHGTFQRVGLADNSGNRVPMLCRTTEFQGLTVGRRRLALLAAALVGTCDEAGPLVQRLANPKHNAVVLALGQLADEMMTGVPSLRRRRPTYNAGRAWAILT